jgi:hypothetical protein
LLRRTKEIEATITEESNKVSRASQLIPLKKNSTRTGPKLGKCSLSLISCRNYEDEFTEGKMIGGKMFYQRELEEYKQSMEGRRIYLSNLSYETQWKYLKDHMRRAGDVVRVDIF